MTKTTTFHGSDLEEISAFYRIPPESILPFADNVNPLGFSPAVRQELAAHLDVVTRYPDRNYTALKEAIGQYLDVSPSSVAIGNGSTELISLFIRLYARKKALLLSPSYSEYERELSLNGCGKVSYFLRREDDFRLNLPHFLQALDETISLLILCNPNNPTSSAICLDEMEEIIRFCKARNIYVMIDETYVEFAPADNISSVSLTKRYDNLMVIRGVSKFFAAPGLRLGYGVTGNRHFLAHLQKLQNPWSLNSIAAFAGERLFRDTDYIQQTKELIRQERLRCQKALSAIPALKLYPSFANFQLVQILRGPTSPQVFEAAIREGFLIRDCSSFAGLKGEYVRFCYRLPQEDQRLLEFFQRLFAQYA